MDVQGTANPVTAVRCRLNRTGGRFPGGRAAELRQLRMGFSDRRLSQPEHHHGCQCPQPCGAAGLFAAPNFSLKKPCHLLMTRHCRSRHHGRTGVVLRRNVHAPGFCPRVYHLGLLTVELRHRHLRKVYVCRERPHGVLREKRRGARAAAAWEFIMRAFPPLEVQQARGRLVQKPLANADMRPQDRDSTKAQHQDAQKRDTSSFSHRCHSVPVAPPLHVREKLLPKLRQHFFADPFVMLPLLRRASRRRKGERAAAAMELQLKAADHHGLPFVQLVDRLPFFDGFCD